MDLNDAQEWKICLTHLLDPSVSEVETNGPNEFFIKKSGKRIHLSDIKLNSEERYLEGIEAGLLPATRPIEEYKRNSYIYEAPLDFKANGERIRGRVHIILPPACDVPQVTIAKKSTSLISLDAIASKGSMAPEMMEFLRAAMKSSLTIVFSGGTGAGKDLHKDTLLATPNGLVRAEEIQIGDYLIDENGKATRVINKYSPLDPKHYELTFDNQTTIKTGMGHLWKVEELTKKQTFGHKTKPLLSDEQIKIINKELLDKTDEYISRTNLMKLLNKSKKSQSIDATIHGFAISGDELFSFVTEEIIDLVSNSSILKSSRKRIIAQLEYYDNENISLGEIKHIVNNRHLMVKILPQEASLGSNVFYNKREIMAHLLKENDKRIEARRNLDLSDENTIRPISLLTSQEIFDNGVLKKDRLKYAVSSLSGQIEFEEKDLPIHPYLVGAWLGDGYSDRGEICGVDKEIINYILSLEEHVTPRENINNNGNHIYGWKIEGLTKKLKDFDLIKNKSIPSVYKYSSTTQRIELIAGLVDTNGYISSRNGSITLEMTNENIIKDAREIVASLGWKPTKVANRRRGYMKENEYIECKRTYRFTFIPNVQFLQVERKRHVLEEILNSNLQQQSIYKKHYITNIELINDKKEDYFCFEVESENHMFLCSEDFIPTHNTTMLEACTKLIPDSVRIGIAEDTPELSLTQSNVTYLHSFPWKPGMDPNDVATLSWVVQQFQRMRTDRLIIGETRGMEFASFLTAANSGMEGSMTTIHANNPVRCLDKMTNFALKGSERQPIRAVNTDIANAIDLIVQLIILPDGRHKVAAIQEIVPTISNGEDARITTNELYKYDPVTDKFIKSENMNKIRIKMEEKGIETAPLLATRPGTILPVMSSSTLPNTVTPTSSRGLPIPNSTPRKI